jgi:hypothetical protein
MRTHLYPLVVNARPVMVWIQGAKLSTHTAMVELQEWYSHPAGMSARRSLGATGFHEQRERRTNERNNQQWHREDPFHKLPSSGRVDCSPPSSTVRLESKSGIRGSQENDRNQIASRNGPAGNSIRPACRPSEEARSTLCLGPRPPRAVSSDYSDSTTLPKRSVTPANAGCSRHRSR